MSVNGITSNAAKTYETYQSDNKDQKLKSEEKVSEKTTPDNNGVIYESTAQNQKPAKTQKYKPDANMIARMKADAENQKAQLLDLVHKMMNGQANTHGKANNIWNDLRTGNFSVDSATQAQAQKDIADDGYWGVGQTSQRILDFASALTGGDPDKIEEMRSAFEKGFKQAEKTWGGKLPDISQRTYDAVMDGFDQMKTEAGL